MEVGETYEVHWPNSAFGSCGTVDQYQTPFYDGVLCHFGEEGDILSNLAFKVGVQAQIYTVVNDEAYFYPDMIRGWFQKQHNVLCILSYHLAGRSQVSLDQRFFF